jgi:hypothetical protein
MPRKKRTVGQASLLLAKYEQLNSDIPRETRRQLAAFLLARKIGKAVTEELFQCKLGRMLRHTSWMWYTAMRTSGLGHLWDDLAACRNSGTKMSLCLNNIRDKASEAEWRLLSDRMGVAIFYPGQTLLHTSVWHHSATQASIWTRGGVWYRRNNFTRIIVLGEHLERTYDYNTPARKLGPDGARRLEDELHNVIDEETHLYPDAVAAAVEYTRNRLPELANYRAKQRSSYKTVSWFFQQLIPLPGGWTVSYRRTSRRRNRDSQGRSYTWLGT